MRWELGALTKSGKLPGVRSFHNTIKSRKREGSSTAKVELIWAVGRRTVWLSPAASATPPATPVWESPPARLSFRPSSAQLWVSMGYFLVKEYIERSSQVLCCRLFWFQLPSPSPPVILKSYWSLSLSFSFCMAYRYICRLIGKACRVDSMGDTKKSRFSRFVHWY